MSNEENLTTDSMKHEIETLTRRMFELESQCSVPHPQKVGNLLEEVPKTFQNLSLDSLDGYEMYSLKTKMHFYELCGTYVKDCEDEIKVCYRSVHNSREYFICIKKGTDHMEVKRHFLPPIVPLKDLIENYLKDNKNFSKFCRKIYHYIAVHDDRINQINVFKNSEKSKKLDFFVSHSTHHIKLDIKLECEDAKMMCVNLKYQPDFVFPKQIILECNMPRDQKASIMEKCQIFKTRPLLEAVKIALFNCSGD